MGKIKFDENGKPLETNKVKEENTSIEVKSEKASTQPNDKKGKKKNKDKVSNDNEQFNSSLDSKYNQSKAALGVLLSCVLLIFAPIIGAVKYPKGTRARKTFMRASILTLIVIALIATAIGVLCYVFIFLITEITQGTTEGIIDGVINGANIISYLKLFI